MICNNAGLYNAVGKPVKSISYLSGILEDISFSTTSDGQG